MSPPDGARLFDHPRYIVFQFCFIESADHFVSATSVDVERTFSQGRLVLSHVQSRLSVQSTRALMCLGVWSTMGYVKDTDVLSAAVLPEVDGEEEDLDNNWDAM